MPPTTGESVLQRMLDMISELPAERAEALAGRMLRDDPSSDLAHFALGLASRRTGRLDVAIGALRNAGRLNRDSALIARSLGETFLHAEQPALARIAFNASLERSPHDIETSVGLAVCHASVGDTPAAEQILRRVLRFQPRHPVACLYMGLIVQAEGDPDDALPWFQASVQASPGSATAGLHLGLCRAALGDHAGAEEAFLAVLSHSPEHPEVRLSLQDLAQAH